MAVPLAILGDLLLSAGGIGAAVATGRQLVQGWRAKSHLASELRKEGITATSPPQTEASVRRVARRLKASDRRYVEAALGQGSERARQNYIDDAVAAACGELRAAQSK